MGREALTSFAATKAYTDEAKIDISGLRNKAVEVQLPTKDSNRLSVMLPHRAASEDTKASAARVAAGAATVIKPQARANFEEFSSAPATLAKSCPTMSLPSDPASPSAL